jgi:ABC-type nitrate/sulfonate/bicarbonate transport system ATPase subunit
VLLMDEPFGALDARTRQELQDTLLKIFHEERTLCFFVTHDTEEAVYLADRIVIMSTQGEIREDARIKLSRPRDRYSKDFTDIVRRVDKIAWEAKS